MSIPKSICDTIHHEHRNFLGGSTSEGDKRKLSLVKWDIVTRPKAMGIWVLERLGTSTLLLL